MTGLSNDLVFMGDWASGEPDAGKAGPEVDLTKAADRRESGNDQSLAPRREAGRNPPSAWRAATKWADTVPSSKRDELRDVRASRRVVGEFAPFLPRRECGA